MNILLVIFVVISIIFHKPFHLIQNPKLVLVSCCSSSMARLLRSLRKPLTLTLTHQFHHQQQQLCISRHLFRRSYISEMRKEAFEGNILRLLRNEIQYEIQSSPSPDKVPFLFSFPSNFYLLIRFQSFEIHRRTTFNGSVKVFCVKIHLATTF